MDKDLEERENDNIEREYKVTNASSKVRPGWVEDAELWASKYGKDVKKNRYFSFESTAKVDREIACNVAEAKVKASIAGEITSFIEKVLGSSKEGQASIDENNPETKSMSEFVETTLAQKTMAMIHGAATIKTYWEKRKFLKELGAKKDYVGYTCAVLVRMDSENLKQAVQKAAELVEKNAEQKEVKDNVKQALKNVDDNFIKARQGQI
jgi:hypothetical protein